MKRRDFLKSGLAAAGGAALSAALPSCAPAATQEVSTVRSVTARTTGGLYTPNRAPLAPAPFLKLPPAASSRRAGCEAA